MWLLFVVIWVSGRNEWGAARIIDVGWHWGCIHLSGIWITMAKIQLFFDFLLVPVLFYIKSMYLLPLDGCCADKGKSQLGRSVWSRAWKAVASLTKSARLWDEIADFVLRFRRFCRVASTLRQGHLLKMVDGVVAYGLKTAWKVFACRFFFVILSLVRKRKNRFWGV